MDVTTAPDDPRKYAGKSRGRPFEPGNAGKPKGARHRATMLAEQLISADIEAVTRAVIGAAEGGDMVAARLILERLVPVRKGRPIAFDLPACDDAMGINIAFAASHPHGADDEYIEAAIVRLGLRPRKPVVLMTDYSGVSDAEPVERLPCSPDRLPRMTRRWRNHSAL
jgi:hypothetical protein